MRIVGSKKDSDYNDRLRSDVCIEDYEYLLSTLEEFLDKYPGQPKMSLEWFTNVARKKTRGRQLCVVEMIKIFIC